MTAAEACAVLVALVQELSATRRARDVWRTIALEAINRASEVSRENAMIARHQYVHRTHTSRPYDDRRQESEAA